jgi:hypothetical protein
MTDLESRHGDSLVGGSLSDGRYLLSGLCVWSQKRWITGIRFAESDSWRYHDGHLNGGRFLALPSEADLIRPLASMVLYIFVKSEARPLASTIPAFVVGLASTQRFSGDLIFSDVDMPLAESGVDVSSRLRHTSVVEGLVESTPWNTSAAWGKSEVDSRVSLKPVDSSRKGADETSSFFS